MKKIQNFYFSIRILKIIKILKKIKIIKTKVNKWDLIKLKSYCTMKETSSKMKRQSSDWEKIIANEATDKELISKICKQLNTRKINNPVKKMGQRTKQTFL